MSTRDLPVIDVSALRIGGDASATAEAIDRACRDTGFFYVAGHGVSRELQDDLDRLARAFFAMPDVVKAEIAMARGGRAWRGWFPVGGELTSGVPDRKEGIYFGAELPTSHPRVASRVPLHGANLFPSEPEGFAEVVLTYMAAMTELGHVLARGMALALGHDEEWFARRLTTDPLVLFRIFHYPPEPPDAAGEWGVGEHTDYGLLTILRQDHHGGLQVRAPDGWIDAPPIPDTFVCNLGDMLERMTAGRYRSTPHRVRNRSGASRLSFPFFFDPSWDARVPELPGTYGDYVLSKVSKVFPDLSTEVL